MSIYDQVLAFIRDPQEAHFQTLALDVFRYQFASVAPYRAFCNEIGGNPQNVHRVEDIPMVSNVAFKCSDLSADRASGRPEALRFLTSGTTQGRERRGRHVVPRPEIYRASALSHLRRMLFPDGVATAMLALHPTADRMPESSLATMISWCIEEFGTSSRLVAASREGVDPSAAIDFLREMAARQEPVCILGTTAAFMTICSEIARTGTDIPLPRGSRLMDTGGAKGQASPASTEEVIRSANDFLGIAPEMVINEYGMTELCSQLYDATTFNFPGAPHTAARFKIAPPWMRVTARDPATMQPVDEGEPGLLTFFDLANVGSVSAVMTEDLGVVESQGVRVIGRSSLGAARGCALSIAQFSALEQGSAR
jgi:hypothetical protein